jgi:hypothetical protein
MAALLAGELLLAHYNSRREPEPWEQWWAEFNAEVGLCMSRPPDPFTLISVPVWRLCSGDAVRVR